MTHRFTFEAANSLVGTLYYSDSDQGFTFRPRNFGDLAGLVGEGGGTSLVAGTLQLEVAVDTGCALYAWGYLPKGSWRPADLKLPSSVRGRVAVELDDPSLEAGISVPIARVHWEVLFDERSGLVRVLRDRQLAEELVEISSGVYLGLSETVLNSFWLSPEFTE